MKAYVQFFEIRDVRWNNNTMAFVSCEPFEADCLGTDGRYILDGRSNLDSMVIDAQQRAYAIRNVCKVDGFKIVQATSFRGEGKVVYHEKYSNRDCRECPRRW